MANAAEHTLDARYYIWHNDLSGTLLFDALHRAANRGVHVRLLLDDNDTSGLDALLGALDSHPNIEIRLFNPFKRRRWRLWGYLTDFTHLNHRMHNKSFTVDGQVTIIGGRNIGDEYFDAGNAAWFVDLDVLAIGPVVRDVSQDFDRYWTSASAIPAARVLAKRRSMSLAEVAGEAARVERLPAAAAYIAALARTSFVQDLLAHHLHFEWAATHLLSDDPAKGLGRAPEAAWLWPRLKESLGAAMQTLRLVSPYFVPGSAGVAALTALARQGVQVEVLTNALEATDVVVVHAGYAKRRAALLRAGIVLFELKRANARTFTPVSARKGGWGSGSSASSLHAKAVSVDGARVFIGSFNFDPRSARLNTEMGFVIDSPLMADAVAQRFVNDVPIRAYRVRIQNGKLHWIDRDDGREVVHDREPGIDLWRRLAVSVFSRLPIEWLL